MTLNRKRDHIVINQLDISYRAGGGRELHAVKGASLTLARGDTLGIVGESGSGKSTLARALLGYMRSGARVAQGRVMVGGTDVFALPPKGLRQFRGKRAALVPQNPLSSLTPHMKIGHQLQELIRQHTDLRGSEAQARVIWLLKRTGLPDPDTIIGRYPHEISGGQRQRVVIAAALTGTPELIILDEPTTALDKTVEAEVLQLVKELQQEIDATLIYVSHDLHVIKAMCAKVAVMRAGRIVEQGRLARVFSAPQEPYTRQLIASIPRISDSGPEVPEAASEQTGLIIRNLSFRYDSEPKLFARKRTTAPTLNDISFCVDRGQTLGVVGESGSGKSTLANLISGAIGGHSGEITFDGERLVGKAIMRAPALRRRIQVVFQDPLSSLNPSLPVRDILIRPRELYFGQTRRSAEQDLRALLSEMDLAPEVLGRFPRQLSGGQQQRIAICRALAAEPELLICDEVTSALDVTIQNKVLDMLLRVQRQRGLTCVFISHDLSVIGKVSHKVAVLQRGELKEFGPRNHVMLAPKHAYTSALLKHV
ncbi:dipeptide ABC transporter ATP-binding protein [Celeribacter halophilus]|uniref:dipeptide ABC transporter ATP-binding protein n=1 Tax=Celeribacter halophilus TaxID=576117 RepID=UPI003A932817